MARRDNLSLVWGPWRELGASAAVSLCHSVPHLHPSARLTTEGMAGGFACSLPFIFQLFAREFARCFVDLGRDEGVWVEALPQPGCLILPDYHRHIIDAGAKSRAWPWVSVSGLFSCVAELCRKGFSQSWCLDLSGFWEWR